MAALVAASLACCLAAFAPLRAGAAGTTGVLVVTGAPARPGPGRPPPPGGTTTLPATTQPPVTTQPAVTSPSTTSATTGGSTVPGGAPTSSVLAAATSGLLAASNEAAILSRLHALPSPVSAGLTMFLGAAHLNVPTTTSALVAALATEQGTGRSALTVLLASSQKPSQYVAHVLSGLSTADTAAVQAGGTVSLTSTTLLYALDDLANRAGRPVTTGVQAPNPAEIAAVVNADVAAAGGTSGSTTSTTPVTTPSSTVAPLTAPVSSRGSGGSSGLVVLIVLVVAALAAVGVWLAVRARKKQGGAAPLPAVPARAPGVPASGIDDLMEVSRRLAAATTEADVQRATVREALGLVRAAAGALVVRQADPGRAGSTMRVAFQSQEGLLVADRLSEGILQRVAETGQPLSQVSATEPSLRNLPASVAVIPVVGSGQVEAVLVVVRDVAAPFGTDERALLSSLTPVAAAALATARHADSLAQASLVDALTSLGNRRRLDADLPRFLQAASATANGTTGVVMIDLDHFKSVNDTYGHPVGDALLAAVAYVVHSAVRPQDRCYRYGGEEFCVVLPDTVPAEAQAVAERIAAAVRSQEFHVGTAEPLRKTASLGVAVTAGPGDRDAEGLVRRADAALYQAKETGRDRVVADRTPAAEPLG